ncbi:DUF234 domain-containing protein [Gordonibacter pamelaeae]|uniref:DUF234 domain-containing protein n=1 Tax=Gordonibacter pamelaeae TaxID=471189 RepID=UPI001D08CFA8|nr:DUF234 domain-containing protein [Gordonibacter pamelaeae]MCB6311164.1 hypothetical protein [Gordonibacter pamelaeae]
MLRVDSFLYGEPDSYLQQELRDPAMYNAITRAVAMGIGRPSEIADAAGMEAAVTEPHGVGRRPKRSACCDANRKRVRYRIADNLFRFWYRFVPQYATPLQAGRQEEIARLIEERHLPIYLGPAFEDVCRQWLLREMGTSRVPLILDIGRWWGNDPGRREQAEIDIVALCDEGEVLFAECKWREKPTDVDVLETLKHRSQLIPAEKRLLFLFSKSGLTEACCNRANAIGATLVSLDEVEL